MAKKKKQKVVVVSGGFDPLHLGHLRMFKEASKLGRLVVIINSDGWLRRKKGAHFMSATERAEIIKEFECVDEVFLFNSVRLDVGIALQVIEPDIFANGGDRKSEKDLPEADICREMGIKMVFNIGGKKIRSSSEMLVNYCDAILRKADA